jgi:hypothetical protein
LTASESKKPDPESVLRADANLNAMCIARAAFTDEMPNFSNTKSHLHLPMFQLVEADNRAIAVQEPDAPSTTCKIILQDNIGSSMCVKSTGNEKLTPRCSTLMVTGSRVSSNCGFITLSSEASVSVASDVVAVLSRTTCDAIIGG